MSTLDIKTAAGGHAIPTLPGGAWDPLSFLANLKNYGGQIGSGLVAVLGLALVIWAAVLVTKKLTGGQSQQHEGWGKIIIMFLFGGVMCVGGFVTLMNIASGGQQAVTDLGGGFIVLSDLIRLGR